MYRTSLLVLVIFISLARLCSSRTNVLFLIADDMRPQIGAYEGKHFPAVVSPKMHTPSIDVLASRSLLLERSYCQLAICAPSRSSLLTGRRPDTTRVYEIGPYFREVGGNFTTLPQYFKMNGYLSVGMGKVFHPGEPSGWDDPVSWSDPYFSGKTNFESFNSTWSAVPDELLIDNPLIDEQIANQAIATMQRLATDARSGKQPFFLAVGFRKPHLPFVFPESFLKYYPVSTVKLPSNPYIPVNMPDAAWFDYPRAQKTRDVRAFNVTGESIQLCQIFWHFSKKAYYCSVSWRLIL
ncbi:iduronate 2-sulfatase-like [Ruditapes philippinarum]|uniref:iduronate 2-sulfatase-like n=1 Tax=Ruditapes philippinarum TaxID=129788 RepID=UPI00295C2A00|nr:iduronate 2-sulfatase-like [Ruditapes philippinarum]